MTGPTHKQYSICFAYLTAMLFYKLNITQINYYLAIIILLMASRKGAIFPDLDHSWNNVSEKNFINKVINIMIHMTRGKHRSWQTHSIDICVYFTIGAYTIPQILYTKNLITKVNKEVLMLMLLGFASGWISHLISDMLTSEGVRLICFVDFKIRFVPKQIGKIKFNTGHEWEAFNFNLMKCINFIMGWICVLYPIILKYY